MNTFTDSKGNIGYILHIQTWKGESNVDITLPVMGNKYDFLQSELIAHLESFAAMYPGEEFRGNFVGSEQGYYRRHYVNW